MSGGVCERREVLWADFDALDSASLLWWPDAGGDDARARAVRRAVEEALSPKQREVVVAYFFEGLSEPEIARQLGIAQQVVHKRIHGVRRDGRAIGGALRKLAEALAPLVRS